jgi:KDO2-lipid IV(A) lauroyltransferase
MFDSARRRAFAGTIAKKDVRGLLRTLSQGGVVAYSADQNFTYQNAFVPFFGVPAATLTTTPQIVARGRAVMLPFFFHRDADGVYQLRIDAPWPGWQDGTPEQAAAIYMRELEAFVREHPSQYLWVHRRFKTRPVGEKDVYS